MRRWSLNALFLVSVPKMKEQCSVAQNFVFKSQVWPSANCPHKWVLYNCRIFQQHSEPEVEIGKQGKKDTGGIGHMNNGSETSEVMSWAVSSVLKFVLWTKLSLKGAFSYKIIHCYGSKSDIFFSKKWKSSCLSFPLPYKEFFHILCQMQSTLNVEKTYSFFLNNI